MISGQRPVGPGSPEPLGVTVEGNGINVAVFSAHAGKIEFCLFDHEGGRELERIPLLERTGDVFHAHLADIPVGARYGLRAYGPYAPNDGHRFNPAKLLVDPHALALDRPFLLDPAMRDYVQGTGAPDDTDSAPVMPKAIVTNVKAVEPWLHAAPWRSTVISELHVRGFTMRHPGVPEAVRGTFAGLSSPAALDHLVKLGVTAVELLPTAAWIDERHLPPLGLTNYWGYNPVAFSVPDLRLAPGGWAEVQATTAALNRVGIEVILDVVYNHTGESDELGPSLSLRGLDNATYYRLRPDDRALYVNDSACGNILACDRAPVIRLVLDSLRNWVKLGGINGFRFDLAPTLGRRMSGFEREAPMLAAIEQDPVLRDVKLIAEPWDIGPGGYQLGQFDAHWGEWNDHYRDVVRRFWRGDGSPAELAGSVSGSETLFGAKRRPSRSVNFVSAHDGFTLTDLVSYTTKRNHPNGEDNRDGTNDNFSWNSGHEGPTDDPVVQSARIRDQKNLLATLLLSRGTPMLGPSTERCLSQNGNNNAYAQDNDTAWTDWTSGHDLTGFIRHLIDIRQANPAITEDRFLTGQHVVGNRFPDVEWRRPDGNPPGPDDWNHPHTCTLVATLAAPDRDGDNRVVIIQHSGFDPLDVTLPETRAGHRWRVRLDTAEADDAGERVVDGGSMLAIAARSVVMAQEERGMVEGASHGGPEPELLDRLAHAAGIAPDWSGMNGIRHAITPETKATILSAMGLAIGSTGEVRDSLELLATRRDRRALPATLVGWAESDTMVSIVPQRSGHGHTTLTIAREDGSTERMALNLDDLPRDSRVAADGRPVLALQVKLPPQPLGRHRVWLDNDPGTVCSLTVAPPRCFLPERLASGHKAFGISAQLYTLRSGGDQGIGDFSTLAQFAQGAGRHGAELVGLNPLHSLSAENRDQVSPYYPSDRRFLEPLYIDVTAPEVRGESAEVEALLTARAGEIAGLKALGSIDYARVWALKKSVLQTAFAGFDRRRKTAPSDPDIREFEAFVQRGGRALADYAVFAAVSDERNGAVWWTWPEDLRRPEASGVAGYGAANPERHGFQLYLQWLADRQLAQAARAGQDAGLRFGFYRDLAVGTSHGGAEAWANQGVYAAGISVGAPPDAFSANGQTWGLPPPNPVVPGRAWLDVFSGLLAANMRHAGALRIDHAMGLSRLFWIPEGAPGSAGAYVHYPFEAMLGELALESHRARCLVIGEDLGTVPEGFRERLSAADILSYRVLFFEREGLTFLPPSAYPEKAVACVATHDLPTFAGWWRGAEIAERRELGSFTADEADRAEADRSAERHKLTEALGRPELAEGLDPGTDLVAAVHHFAASAPSMLVMAQADDLVGETVAINLPGTGSERPNWRRRLKADAATLFDQPLAEASLPVRPTEQFRSTK